MKLVRRTHHDGDSEVRWRLLRRLTLRGPDGEVFLDRWGIDLMLLGVYVHRLAGPDPGLDLHDHPWPFVSLVLWGGYTDENAETREAPMLAGIAEAYITRPMAFGATGALVGHAGKATRSMARGEVRTYRRGQVRRCRLDEAHRIVHVEPSTWTLVLRGRKLRRWGFYLPSGWVSQYHYDYADRRPVTEHR